MKAVLEALDRRLDPLSRAPAAVGLSGGGDSLALLNLAIAWAGPRGRPVLALTVDHGLQPDSAMVAEQAGLQAEALGARWRGLVWAGEKPTTGLQARARAARHALLAEATRAAGAQVLLLGHTLDDVAEGEVMRAGDAPGLGRLREWTPSPVWPEGRGVFLLRPMLGVRREALRNYLRAEGQSWFDDPANDDPRYARVRARRSLTAPHSASPFPNVGVPALAGREGSSLAKSVEFGAGGASFSRCSLIEAGAKADLAALLVCVSGTTRPPRGPELDRLIGAIAEGRTATLGGCRVSVEGDRVMVRRAPPRRGAPERPLEPTAWVAQRFAAACGLYPNEASIPPPS